MSYQNVHEPETLYVEPWRLMTRAKLSLLRLDCRLQLPAILGCRRRLCVLERLRLLPCQPFQA
jgi:hypothetical protein